MLLSLGDIAELSRGFSVKHISQQLKLYDIKPATRRDGIGLYRADLFPTNLRERFNINQLITSLEKESDNE